MYFRVSCPHCEKHLKVRDEYAGRRVGCPFCKRSFTIPAQTAPEKLPPSIESESIPDFTAVKQRPAAGRPKPAPARPQPQEPHAGGGWSTGTDVNMLVSGMAGLALALSFYVTLLPFHKYWFAELFLARGRVPYALVFLMGWSLAILCLKWRMQQRQKASMLFDLLPTELSEEITLNNRTQFVDHVNSLPAEPGESFLVDRVRRGLEHFGVRKSSPEVGTILASQSEIDATGVDSSYTMLKVFIWAIPILGFIGTVIGISAAVGGFSGSLEQAEDISVLKNSLNSVTSGLATAFDTTLIALVMSLLVMFPTSALQKGEEDLLNWVDEYCNENLLKRLNDGREGGAERGTGVSPALQRAIESSLASHHAELRAWTKRLESIGETLTQQVMQGWTQVNLQVQADDRERLEQQAVMQQQIGDAMQQSAERVDRYTREGLEQQAVMQQQIAEAMQQSAERVDRYTSDLEKGLCSLAAVLESLGEKQVLVQQVPRRKRGWFFRRTNGEP